MKQRDYIVAGIIAVILVAVSFVSGMQFQKSLKPAVAVAGGQGKAFGGVAGGRGGRFGGARPIFGTVTSISGTTMTITSQTGNTVTVLLAGNPTISNNGASASVSDIATGASVAVVGTAGTDGTIAATRILLNPSFGGGQPAAPTQTTPSGT